MTAEEKEETEMTFCSLDFLFLFLPIFLVLHGVTRGKTRNAVLLGGSLLFYFFASGKSLGFLLLLIFSLLFNYFLGRLIAETKGSARRSLLLFGVVLDAGILLFYKYACAVAEFFIPLFGENRLTQTDLLLPLGLSFYTFKNISYLHEVSAGRAPAERSLVDYGAYLALFPQISMGPIMTYADFRAALKRRTVTLKKINAGMAEFILGFGLKMIFANRIGAIWNGIDTIGYDGISTPLAWMGLLAYALQLYFDFYGYSLMASGLGGMLGYYTPKNFNYPYLSGSVSDFWRRWHITLGDWFKENVYIPLGGNRRGKGILLRNLFVVWFLTGIWHGNTLNFMVWGLFLFFFIVLEKFGFLDALLNHKVLSHVYVLTVILFSWLLFRLPTLADVPTYLSRLFPFFTKTPEYVFRQDWVRYMNSTGLLLAAGVLFCTPLPRRLYLKIKNKAILAVPLLLLIFWYSVYCSARGANDPFLYMNY